MVLGGTDSRLDGNPAALMQWIVSIGGQVGPLVLDDDPEEKGWGLKAARDAPAGAVLATVPRRACIGTDFAYRDPSWPGSPLPKLKKVLESLGEDMWEYKLAIAVLTERVRTRSFFQPYIQNLPAGYSGIPIFFSTSEASALQDLYIMLEMQKRAQKISDITGTVLADAHATGGGPDDPFNGHSVDANALGWGVATATSRALRLEGPDRPPEMVPLMDMLNHNPVPNVEVFAEGGADGVVRLRTLRPVRAGEWLEINYGEFPNDRLLLDYGFTQADNPQDQLKFRFEANVLDAARAVAGISDEPFGGKGGRNWAEPWQMKMLGALKLDGRGADYIMRLGGPQASGGVVDRRLLAALRVLFARNREEVWFRSGAKGLLASEGNTPDEMPKYIERRVLSTVVGLCAVLLRTFGTSMKDDEELLFGRPATNILIPGADMVEALTQEPRKSAAIKLPVVRLKLKDGRRVAMALGAKAAAAEALAAEAGALDPSKPNWQHFLADPSKSLPPGLAPPKQQLPQVEDSEEESEEEEGDEEEGGGTGVPPGRLEARLDEEGNVVLSTAEGTHMIPAEAVEQRKRLRASKKLSWEMTQALRYRIGKKKVLMNVIAGVSKQLQALGVVNGHQDMLEKMGETDPAVAAELLETIMKGEDPSGVMIVKDTRPRKPKGFKAPEEDSGSSDDRPS